MPKNLVYRTNNQQSLEGLSNFISYLNDKHKGKEIEYQVEIKRVRPIRSVSHNRFYWAILRAIAVPTGYSEEELHDFFKKKFNGKYVIDELIGQTTSNMDSAEFNIYVKKVRSYAENDLKEFKIKIIDPADKFYETWEQATKNQYNEMIEAI